MVRNKFVNYDDYFIDDVMLVNPKFFHDNLEKILDACKFVYDNGYPYCEQDALNYCFSKTYLKLPLKFDVIVRNMRWFFTERRIEKAIYHFAGLKPDLNTDDVYNRLYFEYFLKTPYATADMFGNINKFFTKSFNTLINESKNDLLHFTNLLTGRERAFFVDEKNVESIRQIFAVKENELIVNSSNNNLENLINVINESKGKKIFFILFDNYSAIRNVLLKQGFIEGNDFVNILSFLSEKHGVKINFDSREIVQEI